MNKKSYPTPNKIQLLIKRILIVLVLAGVLTYSGFELHKFATGPKLNLAQPTQGQTLSNALFTVKGTASNISKIQLNDRKIFIDQEGAFSERLLAHPGYNIITLEAWDKFGRHIQKTVEIVRKK